MGAFGLGKRHILAFLLKCGVSIMALCLASASCPFPVMIPYSRLSARLAHANPWSTNPFHHSPGVVNGHTATFFRRTPGPGLHHALPEQSPTISCSYAEFFASCSHSIILSLKLQFTSLFLLVPKKLPCTMNCPMSEVPISGEAQRSWHESCGVVQMVAYHGYAW